MSIYKPSLLDKFKDFVNGLRSNWDQYEDHVADFETAKGIITDTFDETRTYAVGDYAIYENVLYKCVEAIEEAGEWDADKWAATNIAEEFKSHLAESSSKHITESGSNENGNYIRFDDGTQICWKAEMISSENLLAGSHEFTWVFPAAFSEIHNYCSLNIGVATEEYFPRVDKVLLRRVSGTSDRTSCVGYVKLNSDMGASATLRWLAMGRWK